jgi:hypothetical protein
VSQLGSGAFWLLGVYETNHTGTGRLRLLKLWKRRELRRDKAPVKRANKKKKSAAAFLGLVAGLKKELAKPQLTKSVRERATKKQIASWNAD